MKIFILEDDPRRIRVFLEALYPELNDTDILQVATDVESAKWLWTPPYDLMFLDHDLGGRQMVESSDPNTGYQFLRRVIPDLTREQIIVHSWNPTGAWAMVNLVQGVNQVAVARWSFAPQVFPQLVPMLVQRARRQAQLRGAAIVEAVVVGERVA
jgi:hypothetical protein